MQYILTVETFIDNSFAIEVYPSPFNRIIAMIDFSFSDNIFISPFIYTVTGEAVCSPWERKNSSYYYVCIFVLTQ